MKKQGFTLIELIVVITILAILGTITFISFKGYSSDARDSVRLSTVNQISTGLNLIVAKGEKLPTPEGSKTITYNSKVVSRVGVVGDNIASIINISDNIKDPSSGKFYDYSVDSNMKKYSVLARYEGNTSFIQTARAEDLSENYISYGTSSGVLVNLDGTSLTSDIDVSALTTEKYKMIAGSEDFILDKSALGLAYSFLTKNTLKNDSSLLGYWDMETTNSTGYIDNLIGNGNYLRPVLGDNADVTNYLDASKNDFGNGIRGKALNQTRDNNDLSDNYCSVTNTNLPLPGGFTVSMYVKRKMGIKPSEEELFTHHELMLRTLPDGDSTGGNSHEYQAYNPDNRSGVTSNHENWDNVVVSYNGSDNFSIYVNGILRNKRTSQSPLSNTVNITKIGCGNRNTNKATHVYNGLIDEVAVWNRGLSEYEVKFIYNKFPR